MAYLSWAHYDEFGRNVRATLGSTPKVAEFSSVYDPATGRLLNTTWAKEITSAFVDSTSYTYTPSGVARGCGRGCTGSSWTNPARGAPWTGRGARWTR